MSETLLSLICLVSLPFSIKIAVRRKKRLPPVYSPAATCPTLRLCRSVASLRCDSPFSVSTSKSPDKAKLNSNYGEYEHIGSPKEGAPSTVAFVQRLRAASVQTPAPSAGGVFSFYAEDSKRWSQRVSQNNQKEIEKRMKSGNIIGPRCKTVYNLFDVDSKGNTGAIEHLITPKSDKSAISFAFRLRSYKGQDVGLIRKKQVRATPKTKKIFVPQVKNEASVQIRRKPRRYESVEPLHKNPWNSMITPIKYPPEATTRISEKYFDKFTDRNVANFKMHFGPRNGKEQIEWQCMLRSPPVRKPLKRSSSQIVMS